MRAAIAITLCVLGCGGSEDASVADASITDSSTSDTAAASDVATGNACLEAGGQCGCAGGCNAGTRHGTFAQDNACPQPCPTCGACSQWCCVPEPSDAGDAATDG